MLSGTFFPFPSFSYYKRCCYSACRIENIDEYLYGAVDHPQEEAEREQCDLGEESLHNVPALLSQALGHTDLNTTFI